MSDELNYEANEYQRDMKPVPSSSLPNNNNGLMPSEVPSRKQSTLYLGTFQMIGMPYSGNIPPNIGSPSNVGSLSNVPSQ